MTRYLFFGLLLAASLFACQESSITSDQLINKWNMGAIIQNEKDVSAQHNPNHNRWIELQADGTFISDGDPYGRNTGKWTFDQKTKELFLDSDVGEGDDSYWIMSSTNNGMILTGTRSAFTRQFSMVWEK